MGKADIVDPPRRLDIKGFFERNGRMIITFLIASVCAYCAGTVLLLTVHVSQRFQQLEETIAYQQTIIKQVATGLAAAIGDLKHEGHGP